MPVRVYCRTGTTSARLVLSSRVKCQEFVATHRDSPSATILVRQSKSPGVLGPKLQELFPENDAEGNFIVPALDIRAQSLSIYDRRNGVGKPLFRLAPAEQEQNSISLSVI